MVTPLPAQRKPALTWQFCAQSCPFTPCSPCFCFADQSSCQVFSLPLQGRKNGSPRRGPLWRSERLAPQALESALMLEWLAGFPAVTRHFPSFTIVRWLWKLNMKEHGGGGKNFYGDSKNTFKVLLFQQPGNGAFWNILLLPGKLTERLFFFWVSLLDQSSKENVSMSSLFLRIQTNAHCSALVRKKRYFLRCLRAPSLDLINWNPQVTPS